jgi:hypothetical protein
MRHSSPFQIFSFFFFFFRPNGQWRPTTITRFDISAAATAAAESKPVGRLFIHQLLLMSKMAGITEIGKCELDIQKTGSWKTLPCRFLQFKCLVNRKGKQIQNDWPHHRRKIYPLLFW